MITTFKKQNGTWAPATPDKSAQPGAIGDAQPACPPTAAEFLAWPSTNPPWLRIAFIHDALVRNQSTAPEKCWPISAPAIAAALGVERKTVQRDIDRMRDELGAPIAYDAKRLTYFYAEQVTANFVEYMEVLRARRKSPPADHRSSKRHKPTNTKTPIRARLLFIHGALSASQSVNAKTVAASIGGSTRTAQRDLLHMRDVMGLPISYRNNTRSYYYSATPDPKLIANLTAQ